MRLHTFIRAIPAAALVLGLILLLISSGSAQTFNFDEEWRWAHFTTATGLPSDHIADMLETNDGTIWVLTTKGIAWFDGYQWTTIDTGKGLPLAPPVGIQRGNGDSILVRYTDEVYYGTRNGFTQLPNLSSLFEILPYQDHFLTLDTKYELSAYYRGGAQKLIHSHIHNIFKTATGKLWYTSDTNAFLYSENKEMPMLPRQREYIQISAIVENRHGKGVLEISRPFDLIGIWEWDSTGILHHTASERGSNVVGLGIDSKGNIICVYKSGDVRICEHNKWTTPDFVPQQLKVSNLLFYSSNGDLWLGSDEGVYLFRNSTYLWSYLRLPSPDLRNDINEVLPLQNGEIWLGSGNGLLVYQNDTLKKSISSINNIPLHTVTGLAEDKKGNIWISSGSAFSGVFRWDGTRWEHFDMGADPSITMIHKIRVDREGNIWFLALRDQATSKVSEEPGTFLYRNGKFIPWTDRQQLTNKRIYAFAEGPDGALWFGALGGIYRWNPAPGKSLDDQGHWTQVSRLAERIWPRAFTLVVDRNNSLWFGQGQQDIGYGLGKITSDGTVEHYTTKDGLIEDHVNDLYLDSSGTLWIATSGGLSSFSNGKWNSFDRNSGLEVQLLWPVVANHDKIYTGTIGGGLAILSRRTDQSPPPRIVMASAIIQGSTGFLHWQAFAFQGETPPENILTRYRLNNGSWSEWSIARSATFMDLEPKTYTFQVQARGVHGQYSEEGNHVVFLVESPVWSHPIFFLPIGGLMLAFLFLALNSLQRRRAADMALRKSEEKFRIMAETTPSAVFIYTQHEILYANPAAVLLTGYPISHLLLINFQDLFPPHADSMTEKLWQNRELKLVRSEGTECWIEITTNSIIFQGVPAMLAAMFDITERKESELHLKALTFELSRTEERERRRLATYLHDTIGQNLAFLKLKFRTFTKNEGIGDANKISVEIKDIVESLIQDSQTLTFELSSPILNELGFEAALGWLGERFQDRHGITCHIEFHKLSIPLPYDLQTMLFNTVRELTANVAKHAHATELTIVVREYEENVIIMVEDNGEGFKEIPKKVHPDKRGGFGLFNIRQRIESLGGTLEVLNLDEGGGCVRILIPYQSLKMAHE